MKTYKTTSLQNLLKQDMLSAENFSRVKKSKKFVASNYKWDEHYQLYCKTANFEDDNMTVQQRKLFKLQSNMMFSNTTLTFKY